MDSGLHNQVALWVLFWCWPLDWALLCKLFRLALLESALSVCRWCPCPGSHTYFTLWISFVRDRKAADHTEQASVIQQGIAETDVAIVQHGSGWSLQSLFFVVVWIATNAACMWFLNGGEVFDMWSEEARGRGSVAMTANSTTSVDNGKQQPLVSCPLWIQVWHTAASCVFAFAAAHVLGLMMVGMRAIRMASGEIVSKIRTWNPPEHNNPDNGVGFDPLAGDDAADIMLLDESCVGTFSEFSARRGMRCYWQLLLVTATVFAVIEDRTWLNASNVAGVCVIGMLLGMGALCGTVISMMALPRASICMHIRCQ